MSHLKKILSFISALGAVFSFAALTHAQTVPAPAAAVGYTTRTYGPNVTVGQNWLPFDGANYTQNTDGSVILAGPWHYNDQIATARVSGTNFTGTAFGGGGYFEATFSFSGTVSANGGWPAFWSNDIEGQLNWGGPTQWPGQPTGYYQSVEPDFVEIFGGNDAGGTIHDWYGIQPNMSDVPVDIPHWTVPVDSGPHKYGFLWVPATATSQGYASWYYDGRLIGTGKWNMFDPNMPPPPVAGSTAWSVIDSRHLYMMLGTGSNDPIHVTSVEVWQNSAANDLGPTTSTPGTGGGTPPPTTGPCIQAYSNSVAVPTGYGAAYDVSAPLTLLIQGDCNPATPLLHVGANSQSQYIYKIGYAYKGGAWQAINLTGAGALISSNWYTANASGPLPYTATDLSSNWNYIVGYVCTWSGTAWKCGCADTACTTSNWQLQAIKR